MNRILRCFKAAAFLCLFPLIAHSQTAELSEIQNYLLENNPELNRDDIQNLIITNQFESKHNGVTHVYAAQSLNGIRVANSSLTSAFDKNGKLRHVASRFFPKITSPISSPVLSLADVITAQVQNEIPGVQVSVIPTESHKANLLIKGSDFEHKGRSELVYFMTAESGLKLAWTFDCLMPRGGNWYSYYVDAVDGSLLERVNWTVSCEVDAMHLHDLQSSSPLPEFSEMESGIIDGSGYRVLEFPIESPNHGARSLVFEPADLLASPFGWHDTDGVEGPEYTITRGNNVYAYEDHNDTDAPGISPDGGSELLFDYLYDPTQLPETYIEAATTNLFYANNKIHDILFNYGFDEASGNFQTTNYTGEGLGSDHVLAECQDGEHFNNANMSSPPDGQNARMQMYLWQAGQIGNMFVINSPSSLVGPYTTSSLSSFGPDIPSEGITSDLALLIDETGGNNACQPAVNGDELLGKIVVVRRGVCNFADKVMTAQNAGAIACIIVNNAAGIANPGGVMSGITIPSFMISQIAGQSIITELENEVIVNATLSGVSGENFIDASFDNGIIIHEYVHGLSIRLTGGSATSYCLGNAEQMGEGWSDWYALMLTMNTQVDNPVYRPMGTFAANEPTDGYGIRPVPYDTSFAVNNYTYADLGNSEITVPHGVGFIWSTMLWDLTWAFMDEYGYDADIMSGMGGNNLVLQLVTDGLKLQPCNPGFVDGRDAILAADELTNNGENSCLIWEVFAKRGLGYSANQGSSLSRLDGIAAYDIPPICQEVFETPTASFSTTNSITCNGVVQFTDESVNVPQSWAWDFGDGEISYDRNPLHIYSDEGIYTVSLTVTNTLGEDMVVQSDIINFSTPDEVEETMGASGCAGEIVSLSANANANADEAVIVWRDENQNEIGIGNELEVELGNQSKSYYAQVELNAEVPTKVGPGNQNIGSGGMHGSEFIGTVDFQAYQPLQIKSVYVMSGATGTRIINLWKDNSETGDLIDQVSVYIDFIGGGRIDLNFDIEIPGKYSIGLAQADLYRNDSGANYPYTAPGLLSITGSSAGPGYYYYLYDFEIRPKRCLSEPVAVLAEVTGGSTFTVNIVDHSVSFTASGNATSWNWDFGDGNSSSEQNPNHTYSELSAYTVSLTTNSDCEWSREIDLLHTGTGIENYNSAGISVYPNPATEFIRISNEGNDNLEQILIRDIQGKIVIRKDLTSGNEWIINTNKLQSGIYALWILDKNDIPVYRQKLTIIK